MLIRIRYRCHGGGPALGALKNEVMMPNAPALSDGSPERARVDQGILDA
ncbi:hypothetical protein NGB36_01750 [Streptomyces sp. RB6PN25]|uniref:Uncharacterized protein n=1 Tax=Streptomyces humicola TaxID=2953240 RepID=A0ABT1PNV8_9ACTN|nr:hypothetical protein [Streptomyces humicola]MCQ4079361.1 hypothetical protein [Streptomyces humicola]